MANPNHHFYGHEYVAMIFFAVLLLIAEIGAGDDDEGSLVLERTKLIVGVPKKCGSTDFFVDLALDPRNKSRVEKAQGFSIDIFNATIAYLQNISVEYVAFANEDGTCVEDYNLLLDQISLRKYDVVVGDVTIVANRSNYVDFTLPYTQSDVMMLVKVRHDPRLHMWTFVQPFSWDMWLSIVIVSVFIGGIILFMERNVKQDSGGPENLPCNRQFSGVSILWFPVVQAVLPQKESVAKNCSRFVLVLWLIFAFVLMQSYSACLSSILTVHQLQPRYPSEYNVINDPNIKIGYQGGSFIKGLLLEKLQVHQSRVNNYSTIEKYKDALDKGSHHGGVDVIFEEVPYIKIFLKKYGSNYAMIETRHRTDGFGFAFPRGSLLTSQFSRAVLNVRESIEMDEIEEKYFGSSSNNNDEAKSLSTSSSDDSTQSSLTTYSFAGLFILIGILSLLALAVSESHIWRKPVMRAKTYSRQLLSRSFTRTSPLEEGSTTRRRHVDDEEGSTTRENNQNVGVKDGADNNCREISKTSILCVDDIETLPVQVSTG